MLPCSAPLHRKNLIHQKYREFVRTLSDEALIKEGKKLRWLSGDGKIVSTGDDIKRRKVLYKLFRIELEIQCADCG
jgi:hypothetical protein